MNFQLLVDSNPALLPATLDNGYLDFFHRIWSGYVGVSLWNLQGWKCTVTIHPDGVAGSRSLRFVYSGITQIMDFAIK